MKKFIHKPVVSFIIIFIILILIYLFIKSIDYNKPLKQDQINSSSSDDKNSLDSSENSSESPAKQAEWNLKLVNKDNLLPENFSIELESVSQNQQFDKRASSGLKEMIKAAKDDNIYLYIVSAYRSIPQQKTVFNNNVQRLINSGLSYDQAVLETSRNIAVPGSSEHNLGLAVDIVSSDWYSYNNDLEEHFDQTKEYRWLNENAHKFGFVERYPKGKTDITGIVFEPWHYRYVSTEHSYKMKEEGLCLEEYLKKHNYK